MAIGVSPNKAEVDSMLGSTARELNATLARVQAIAAWLATQTDAQLIALGYIQAEVNTLRSAWTDLNKLAGVYQGTQTQSPVYDFRGFAKLLFGFGV